MWAIGALLPNWFTKSCGVDALNPPLKSCGVASNQELEPPPQALSPSVDGMTMTGREGSVANGEMKELILLVPSLA